MEYMMSIAYLIHTLFFNKASFAAILTVMVITLALCIKYFIALRILAMPHKTPPGDQRIFG